MRISDWSSDVCSSDLRCEASAVERPVMSTCDGLTTSPLSRPDVTSKCSASRSKVAVPASASIGSSGRRRSEEHTSELQSLMRTSYAVFCLKKKNKIKQIMRYTQMYDRADATHVK